jgi:hypothetical protein
MCKYPITKSKVAVALLGALGVTAPVMAQENFTARMTGIKEVPICLSLGSGTFEATINEDGNSIDYSLTYDKLDGVPTVAHIHLGKPTEAGGIMVNLCVEGENGDNGNGDNGNGYSVNGDNGNGDDGNGDNGNGDDGNNVCSEGSGTVSGTVTAEDVIGPVDQGVEAGDFEELVLAMRRGLTYVNLHSDICPNGEIRGQVVTGNVVQP